MYNILLHLHSHLRWVALLLMVWATARAIQGWVGGRAPSPLDDRLGVGLVIAVDLQTVIGLTLYFVFSPVTSMIFRGGGLAISNPVQRFWGMEHITLGLLAVALVHLGRVRARRAPSGRLRSRRLAIGYGLALVITLAAIPWPFRGEVGRPWLRGAGAVSAPVFSAAPSFTRG